MKTTKEQFHLFQDSVEKNIKKFGLLGWESYFDHENSGMEDANSAIAWDLEGRTATFWLHTDIDEPIDIRKEAFHLVCHLLFGGLTALMEEPHTSAQEVEEEIHAVIRTFENLLYKPTSNP